MPSPIETGHAKNTGNFDVLISFCTGYGPRYNPSKASLQLPALITKHSEADKAIKEVNTGIVPWQNAVNEREIIFEPLKSEFITRINGAVESSDVTPEFIADVKTITRKLTGQRATPKKEDDPATPQTETDKSISASQLSFDNKINNLHRLIELLLGEPKYTPNEQDLSTQGLTALLAAMEKSNKAVKDKLVTISNSRLKRNDILYNPKSGLVQVAKEVKKYVISVFKATSPEYKQISSLKFSIIKKGK